MTEEQEGKSLCSCVIEINTTDFCKFDKRGHGKPGLCPPCPWEGPDPVSWATWRRGGGGGSASGQ